MDEIVFYIYDVGTMLGEDVLYYLGFNRNNSQTEILNLSKCNYWLSNIT